ncbi:MAG: nuclear transport factor 2 family protein [Planctomycetota bacterium]
MSFFNTLRRSLVAEPSSAATGTSLQARVDDLLEHIRTGRILDAMSEFYDDDTVMTEPNYGDTAGLAANIEREKAFLSQVKQFKGFETPAVAVHETAPGTGVALIENALEFINTDDQDVRMEQVSVQRWRDGKIVHERFYYDRGGN